jgi:hypothetical protein
MVVANPQSLKKLIKHMRLQGREVQRSAHVGASGWESLVRNGVLPLELGMPNAHIASGMSHFTLSGRMIGRSDTESADKDRQIRYYDRLMGRPRVSLMAYQCSDAYQQVKCWWARSGYEATDDLGVLRYVRASICAPLGGRGAFNS